MVTRSPAVSSGRVFVSDACPNAFAYNAVTGQQLWHFNACCNGGGGLTPVLHAGGCMPAILIARRTNGIVLDVNNGHRIGLFNSDTPPGFIGNLTFLLQNGTLIAVNSNGQQVWSFAGDGTLQSAPFVVNQTIYIGSRFGCFMASTRADNRSGAPRLVSRFQILSPRCFGNWFRSGRRSLDRTDRKHPRRLRKLRKT